MPLSIPPELKRVTPYIRRAEELDRDKSNAESRLVAYYCRQYAVHTGIGLAVSPPGKNCLGEILGTLEGEKVAMNSFTRDEATFLCRTFAEKIFDKADLEDRSEGGATKATAKTFYAAASFLEILQQFYQDDDESEEVAEIKKRAVYSKWKATDILKAMKEGREPTPGGYGETEEHEETKDDDDRPKEESLSPKVETVSYDDEPEPEPSFVRPPPPIEEEESEEEEDAGTEVSLGPPPPAYPKDDDLLPPPPSSAPSLTFTPPPVAPPPVAPVMPPPPVVKPLPPPEPAKKAVGFLGFGKKKKNGKHSKAEISDALELTKFALAALQDKNGDLAADRLKQALHVLGR